MYYIFFYKIELHLKRLFTKLKMKNWGLFGNVYEISF